MASTASFDDVPTGQPVVREPGGSWRDAFPDPRSIWMILRRNIWVFLILFFLIALNVAIWTARQTPIYTASSSILVQPKADAVLNSSTVSPVSPDLPSSTDIVDTEVRLMQSTSLAQRVAKKYEKLHPGATRQAGGVEALADTLLGIVDFQRSAGTYVIDVRGRSTDPRQAAEVPNLFATEFVATDRETKQNANSNANTFLEQRSRELARNATEADTALQQYKISHGLLSSTNTPLAEQELSSLNSEVAQAQADLAEKQGRLSAAQAQLSRGSGGADVGAALGSGTIGTLRAREAEASGQVAQLTTRYGPRYPDLVRARGELSAVRSQIQLEINRIMSNLNAEVRVSSSRLASLQASRGRSVGVLATNNGAAVGLDELQRKADATKNIYEAFLKRGREIDAQQGLQQADLRVAELAQVPGSPFFPNYRLAALFAILGGLLGGLVSIAVAEYLQGGVRTKEDVERRLKVRYAGAIPTLKSTLGKLRVTEPPHEYIVSHPFSSFAESFRALRTFLLLGGGAVSGASRAVAIVSALPREGKTTTAVCLARASAMAGTPTVLVDCDLRRRGSSDMLIGESSNGLYDYFDGKSLEASLYRDASTGLFVLGTGHAPSSAADPLTSENLKRLIGELRQRFEVIIIDTAPVLGVADARVVASVADRVLLVTHWRKTSIRACEAAIDMLLDVGAKISGIALAQVDINRYASTGHGDSSGYQKKFKGYYTN